MKNKIILTTGVTALVIVLVIALTSGNSYAWLTGQDKTLQTEVGAGHVKISLTGNPDKKDSIFPAEEGKTIDYIITNSSSREVIVQFKAGALTAYVMPDNYLDENNEYIIKEKHEVMKGLSPYDKMNINGGSSEFEALGRNEIPSGDVISKVVEDWEVPGGEYLGMDDKDNQYFRLEENGTASGTFKVALTKDAGNKYQYAIFTIGEATALAAQDNTDAIAAVFEGLNIKSLVK